MPSHFVLILHLHFGIWKDCSDYRVKGRKKQISVRISYLGYFCALLLPVIVVVVVLSIFFLSEIDF